MSLPLKRFAPASYTALGYAQGNGNAYEKSGCLLTPALGAAPARLICSDHPDVSRALHEYLARGLPLAGLSSSPIFAEFRPAPLKAFWESQRAELNGKLKMLAGLGGPTARAGEEIAANLLHATI